MLVHFFQRILSILGDFADNIQLSNNTGSVIFMQNSFSIQVTNVNTEDYSGQTVIIDSGPFEYKMDKGSSPDSGTINTFPGTSLEISQNVTAAVKIPTSIFKDLGLNGSNSSMMERISVLVFTETQPFQSSDENQSNLTLGSIVVAVRVNSSTEPEDRRLSTPIQVYFQRVSVFNDIRLWIV